MIGNFDPRIIDSNCPNKSMPSSLCLIFVLSLHLLKIAFLNGKPPYHLLKRSWLRMSIFLIPKPPFPWEGMPFSIQLGEAFPFQDCLTASSVEVSLQCEKQKMAL